MNTQGQIYRGRFAPSPSGPLHFGSLIAAVASYCQAKANDGVWLVRMEDIDPPREQAGADSLIMQCLEAHGLYWDETVTYQSQRTDAYEAVLYALGEFNKLFYCSCSRKSLRAQLANSTETFTTTVYPGTCRRLRVTDQVIQFTDRVYGDYSQDLGKEVGDFVLKRRDGLYAYQLAVVVDDIAQGITEVVRGVDLIDSTPRQIYLYQCLDATPPEYVHLPLALLADGNKLSKQTGAIAVDNSKASKNLYNVLNFLGQGLIPSMQYIPVDEILTWAVQNWNINRVGTNSKVISI